MFPIDSKGLTSKGEFDCVVPVSGGKDGSYVAYNLKNKFGMNPLCVTWAPLISTELGRTNLNSFIQSGFNHILGTPNPLTTKKLTHLSLKEIGDPFQPFIYGQVNSPLRIAQAYDIPWIVDGENGEVEYGGAQETSSNPLYSMDYMKKINKFPNLYKESLKDIFDSNFFQDIESTWEITSLRECSRQCGAFD